MALQIAEKSKEVSVRRKARTFDREAQNYVLSCWDADQLRIPLRKTLAWDEELSTLLAVASMGNMAVEQVGTILRLSLNRCSMLIIPGLEKFLVLQICR